LVELLDFRSVQAQDWSSSVSISLLNVGEDVTIVSGPEIRHIKGSLSNLFKEMVPLWLYLHVLADTALGHHNCRPVANKSIYDSIPRTHAIQDMRSQVPQRRMTCIGRQRYVIWWRDID
jgi:hypothetical protein